MTHKTLTLLADKLTNIQIDLGQVTCQLHGVSLEAICNQITAQDVVDSMSVIDSMSAFDLVSALVETYGLELINHYIQECIEDK